MNDTNLVELSIPRPQLALSTVDQSIAFANSFDIVDQTTAEIAAAELNFFAEREKALKTKHDEVKRPILEAGRGIDRLFGAEIDKARHGKAVWSAKLAKHVDAEQLKEREAQIKARESQRQEQERLAHEAAKREEESRQQAETLRQQAKAQADAGNTTASAELALRADHAEIAGQQDAQQLIEQLHLTEAPLVEQAGIPKAISPRKSWSEIDVYDLGELVVACAEGKQPMRYLLANEVALRQSAVALKEEFNVPGVRVRPRTVIASKSRR